MVLDDFFGSGIYIVIAIVAVIVVIIAIAALNGMRKPKKQKTKRRNLLSEGKRDHRQQTRLLDSPDKEKRREDKVKQKDKTKTKEKEKKRKEIIEDDEPLEVLAMAHEEIQKDTQKEPQPLDTESIDLPELPSVDTLEESDEEIVEENSNEDLMNIFQVEEAEDSYTSDLAANLFEVDLTSLEKLSKEVLEVYGGKKTKENKENEEE